MRSDEVTRSLGELDSRAPGGVVGSGRQKDARTRTATSNGVDYPELDHLPVLKCMAPKCQNTFRLPWGYYSDGRNTWSGVCGAVCDGILWALRTEKSQEEAEAFLARCATSERGALQLVA